MHKLYDLILSSSLAVVVVIFLGIRILFAFECGLNYAKEELKIRNRAMEGMM